MQSWALVTGATAGIGECFTRLLAQNGYNLVLVARDLPRLQERATALESKFDISTVVLQADLSSNEGCSMIEQYIRDNQIDVLINNAGFGINKAFTVSQLDAEQALLDVLVRTPMRLMHVALPGMKERDKGVIINVSSVAGWIAGGTYSASKSYLTVLSESLHTELTGTKVKISALCPGFTRTEFHQRGRMSMKGLPKFMWLNADKLVEQSWKDAVNGKAVSVPGWQYQLLTFVMRYAPRPMVRKIGMNVRIKQRR
jgi:short-subunit dehydrogenase